MVFCLPPSACCSPRLRGWTRDDGGDRARAELLPAPAGMDPPTSTGCPAGSVRRTLTNRAWLETVDAQLPLPGALRGRVDPRRLDVIVANLVGNALRHGERPVRLRLSAEDHSATGGRRAVIEVLDSGPGIPDSVLPHVFDRFYKSDTARTRTEGSGLGLAITAENVHLHGGTLRAANGPDGGAVFTLELPLVQDESKLEPPMESHP
jgi:two-component system sensor histidine kinase MtrB